MEYDTDDELYSYKDPYHLVEEGLEFITGHQTESSYTGDSDDTEDYTGPEVHEGPTDIEPSTPPSFYNLALYNPEMERLETTWIYLHRIVYGPDTRYPNRLDYMISHYNLPLLMEAAEDIKYYLLNLAIPEITTPARPMDEWIYKLKLFVWTAIYNLKYMLGYYHADLTGLLIYE